MGNARWYGGMMVTSGTMQLLFTVVMHLGVFKDVAGLVIIAMSFMPTLALNFEL